MTCPSESCLRRVLLADEDSGRTRVLAALLRDSGYDVVMSPGGEDTCRRLEGERFTAIISDWNLGGIELLGHIRGNGNNGHTYVIITSDQGEDMPRGMAAGADDFLVKPFEAGLLLARMRVAERIGIMREDISRKNETLSAVVRSLEQVNERMRTELQAAARVQQALLPSPGFGAPGTRIAWRLRPCHELAGDILNCVRLDEHHLAFYVLDVCGHGVSSALLSVQVSRLMSPMMTESELLKQRLSAPPWYRVVEPLGVLQRLNMLFQSSGEVTQYFTMLYGLLHLESGHLRLAAGGHPGPIIVPASGDPTRVPSRSNPVGLLPEAEFFECEMELGIGDRIWCYSDGVTDASDVQGEFLGVDQLEEYVAEQRGFPVESAVSEVMNGVASWSMPGAPDDDCSLLAIERVAIPS